MRNKIVFIVATQYDNVGDLLINKCLINELSNYGDVFLDTKNVPDFFKELLLLDTVNVFDLKKITPYSFKGISFLSTVFKDLGITHIFKSPGPFGSNGKVKVFLRNISFAAIFGIYKLKSVKSYLVGSDVFYENYLDRFSVKVFSKCSQKILCRSHGNVEHLKKIGLKNVGYVPDLCFGYNAERYDLIGPTRVAISFRQLDDVNFHAKIVRTIESILSESNDIELTFFYQVERDYEYNRSLYEIFRANANTTFLDECMKWNDIKMYNQFNYTLSNRLHVLLLGIVHDVIPIALLNDNVKTHKIKDIFESVGLTEFLIEEVSPKEIRDLGGSRELVRSIKKLQRKKLQEEIRSLFYE